METSWRRLILLPPNKPKKAGWESRGGLVLSINNSAKAGLTNLTDGLLIYNTDSKQLEIYSGGTWQNVGGGGGSGDSIPKGTIVAFNKLDCPTGWAVADGNQGTPDLRGKFIRGLDTGGTIDPGRMIGSYQDDELKSHVHSTVQMIYNNSIDGVDSALTYSGEHHNEPRNTGSTGGGETRPKNVALVYCVKLTDATSSGSVTGSSSTGSSGDSFWKSNGLSIFYTDGNVGIGNTNPLQKMEVSGNIKASGNIEASVNLKAPGICLGNDCRSSWPVNTWWEYAVRPACQTQGGYELKAVMPNGQVATLSFIATSTWYDYNYCYFDYYGYSGAFYYSF